MNDAINKNDAVSIVHEEINRLNNLLDGFMGDPNYYAWRHQAIIILEDIAANLEAIQPIKRRPCDRRKNN